MPLVWIIEDNVAFRAGVATALALPPHRHAVRAFESCETALAELDPGADPAVILLDVGLPGMDGIQGIARLKSRWPRVAILILTVFEDDDKIFRAVCAGASGYLLKTQPISSIAAAIGEAIAGGSPMNPRVATRVLALLAKSAPPKADYGLSARERLVLTCMARGMTRKEIPSAAGLNAHTADFVIRCIYQKLHVNCATAAVSIAVREHLIDERTPGA